MKEAEAWNWPTIIGGALALFLLGAALGLVLTAAFGPGQASGLGEEPRTAYYRGVYDTCVGVVLSMFGAPDDEARDYCAHQFVPAAVETGGWYDGDSPGYVKPPPDPVRP
jgi:hypothetical protein